MSWRKHFTPYNNSGLPLNLQTNTGGNGGASTSSNFSSWLPEIYAGSPNRLVRYMQMDQMDGDLEVNGALDTIAEFGTQESETGSPFSIHYDSPPSDSESKIIDKTLISWSNLNKMHKRAFRTFRNVCKYGDQFFIRDPETYEMFWIDPANVEKVIVNESEGKKIETYFIKNLQANFQEQLATNVSALHARPYGSGQGLSGMMSPVNSTSGNYSTAAGQGLDQGVPVDARHVVHISLTDGMDASWPFGVSILEPIFKVYKQKELLEDSIIIYRVHRAPERRVFMIDVGNMPPHKAKQYLEQVKYEVQQKRIPNKNGNGASIADSAYNPMCETLSTKIPLLDGRTCTLKELIEEYKEGKENWVYSCDPVTGKLAPGPITWAGITKKNAQVITLTFDNGKTFTCTPDHKIPVLGRGFVEAQHLTSDDSLISFESREKSMTRRTKDKDRSYTQVYDHELNKWVFVHRMTGEFLKGIDKHQEFNFDESLNHLPCCTVHHADYNRHNNNPNNLLWMSAADHRRYNSATKKDYWNNISEEESIRIKDKIRKGLEKTRSKNKNWKKDAYSGHSNKIKKALMNRDHKDIVVQRIKLGKGRREYLKNNPDCTFLNQQKFIFSRNMLNYVISLINKCPPTLTRNELSNKLQNDTKFISLLLEANQPISGKMHRSSIATFTTNKIDCIYKTFGYDNWKDLKEKARVYNHKIVSIKWEDNKEDVGTLTIDQEEKYHNYHTFAIEAGIFVKNSMLEDYYFAQTADGRGSKVDTLPGGENLGQIDDLRYFNNKLLRGLRIPSSYLPSGPEDGTQTTNDGKVGIAYIQEYRFANYVERLQKQIQEDFDHEFKMYLKYKGITIDNSTFKIKFNKPMNFSSYRELQLDSERANMYSQVADLPYMSKQFALKKYMGLSETEMKQNEELWREENDYKKYQDSQEDLDLKNIGIRPVPDNMVDPEAEPDLTDIAMPADGEGGINTDVAQPIDPPGAGAV